jgi:hypothetical protein
MKNKVIQYSLIIKKKFKNMIFYVDLVVFSLNLGR